MVRPREGTDAERQRLADDIAAAKADEAARASTSKIEEAAVVQRPSVEVLVDRLVAGDTTLDEVAAEFSRREWSVPAMSAEQFMVGDEESSRANYWEPVEVARQLGDLTEV